MINVVDGNRTYSPELPKATAWMNYNGNQTPAIGEVKGPNDMDEMMTIVEVTYDPATNKSRVGFAYGVHLTEAERKALADYGADYDPHR